MAIIPAWFFLWTETLIVTIVAGERPVQDEFEMSLDSAVPPGCVEGDAQPERIRSRPAAPPLRICRCPSAAIQLSITSTLPAHL
jgi:hypothetical protein